MRLEAYRGHGHFESDHVMKLLLISSNEIRSCRSDLLKMLYVHGDFMHDNMSQLLGLMHCGLYLVQVPSLVEVGLTLTSYVIVLELY